LSNRCKVFPVDGLQFFICLACRSQLKNLTQRLLSRGGVCPRVVGAGWCNQN
jgi:hypothetical protein